ncbi:PilN domain-containing protein [Patescibacteria group bacterium]
MAKTKHSINLLPREGFDSTVQGRIMAWALSSFRIIVIVTEIVVMIAFISRFFLDAQNADLTEEIQKKTSLISANQSFEKEFKTTQEKLSLYKDATSVRSVPTEVIDAVVKSLPSDISLDGIVITKNDISVVGISPSTQSIQQLIINLESKDPVFDVNLESVERENIDSELLSFSIRGQV